MGQDSTLVGKGKSNLIEELKFAQNAYKCDRAFSIPNLLTKEYSL